MLRASSRSNVWTYTSIPSVQEILVLHTTRIGAELLRRNEAGAWPSETTSIERGALDLASLGFRASLRRLYARSGLAA